MSTATDSDWLLTTFGELARGDDHEFAHLIGAFESPLILDESRTTVRTHFLATDVNGQPATDQLAAAMAKFQLDFAIPRKRIVQAWKQFEDTKSSTAISSLFAEARDLLVKSDKSGEGGELLLFMLMERMLGYPQLLSKMALKTNTNVHVQGSDGVHAKLGADSVLDLYWGESKLYEDSSRAFTDCFDSIAPFLHPDGAKARDRDLVLLRQQLNVDDDKLAAHLIRYFDETHKESLHVRWNGVCLVGFNVEQYPNPSIAVEARAFAIIAAQVQRWQKSILKRVTDHGLLAVNIDVFCFPLPSVMELRKAVRAKLGVTT